MPERSILKINDIFWSFQGEGARMGVPSVFVRLAGCALKCPYCDQKDAWAGGTPMSEEELLQAIEKESSSAPQSQVVFTGGEPLEQDLSTIVSILKQKDFYLTIETNGTLFQPLPLDWWTVSPKDVDNYRIHPELIPHIDEIKLIVNKNLDIAAIERIQTIVPNVPIYLQPDGFDSERYRNNFLLYRRCQEKSIPKLRCGIQMHTHYNVK